MTKNLSADQSFTPTTGWGRGSILVFLQETVLSSELSELLKLLTAAFACGWYNFFDLCKQAMCKVEESKFGSVKKNYEVP